MPERVSTVDLLQVGLKLLDDLRREAPGETEDWLRPIVPNDDVVEDECYMIIFADPSRYLREEIEELYFGIGSNDPGCWSIELPLWLLPKITLPGNVTPTQLCCCESGDGPTNTWGDSSKISVDALSYPEFLGLARYLMRRYVVERTKPDSPP